MVTLEKDNIKNIDIAEIILLFWSKKFLIISITFVFSIFSILYALNLPNYYKSETLISIRDDEQQNNRTGNQYAGIAQMAGLSLPSGGGEDKSEYVMATIKSRDFFKKLVSSNEMIIPNLFAVKEYNQKNNEILYDSELFDIKEQIWHDTKPSFLQAHKTFIGSILAISKDDVTGYITISIEHLSPNFAYELLTDVVDTMNRIEKTKDMIESEKALAFLKEQSSKANLIGVSTSINSLIEAQIQKKMTSQISDDYLIKYIDKPYTPEERSKPSRSTISIIGFLFGFSLSVLLILIRRFIFNKD
jgi:uncharacterized protein involved in exopolysaccharide biosynthesis